MANSAVAWGFWGGLRRGQMIVLVLLVSCVGSVSANRWIGVWNVDFIFVVVGVMDQA